MYLYLINQPTAAFGVIVIKMKTAFKDWDVGMVEKARANIKAADATQLLVPPPAAAAASNDHVIGAGG